MSLTRELIEMAIKSRDAEMLKEVVAIEHPDKSYKNYAIMEYDGDVPRLFGDKRSIELLIPKDISIIQENAVVDAIESGTLFEDKEDIDNKVDYLTMTHLPKLGMMHKNLPEPHHVHHAIGMVVGAMNPDGHFGSSDADMKNGKNFTMDLTAHGNEKDTSAMDLTSDYLDIKDKLGKGIPVEMRRSLAKVPEEVEDIKEVKAEDTVDEDDYEEIGLDHEDEDMEDDEPDDEDCDDADDDDEDDEEEEDDESKKKSSSKKDDEDEDEEDDDFDEDKEHAIEKYLKGRKDDIKAVKEVATDFKDTTKSSYETPSTSSFSRPQISSYKNNAVTQAASAPAPSQNKSSFAKKSYDVNEAKAKYNAESYREYDEYEMYQESHAMLVKPKKLKPIPRDTVAYIISQKNNIHDANDQAMISSYCCAKLELVDFYLNCLDTHDYRYIVPHNRQYLVQMQNDLNRCLQEVLRVRPVNRMDRVWKVNVTYPEGWGG